MSNLKKVGRIGIKALVYFEVVTTLSLAIGILLAYLIKPGRIDKTGLPIGDASKYTVRELLDSTGTFLRDQPHLAGAGAGYCHRHRRQPEPKPRKSVGVAQAPYPVGLPGAEICHVPGPLGAFGGMAFTIGKFGIRTLKPLAMLMATMYGTMLISSLSCWVSSFGISNSISGPT